MAQITSVTFDNGGASQTLTTDKAVRDAVLQGRLRRDTPVSVARDGMATMTMSAGHVEELARIMDEYGRAVAPAFAAAPPPLQPQPAQPIQQPHVVLASPYYEPPAPRGGGNKVMVPLLAGAIIVLLGALVFLLLRNQSSAPGTGTPPVNGTPPVSDGQSATATEDPDAAPQPVTDATETPSDDGALAGFNVSRVTFGSQTSGNALLDERDSPPSGPTNFVAKFYYAGGTPPQTFSCRLTGRNHLSGQLAYSAGSAWCSWGNLMPGQYNLQFLVGGRMMASRTVNIGGGAAPANRVVSSDRSVLQSRAASAISNYYSTWSPANSVGWMDSVYSGAPRYYGANRSHAAMMDAQTALINRWPSRSYSIVPGTMSTSCDGSTGSCSVRGQVDYSYRNDRQGTAKRGRLWFAFITSSSGDGMVITSENGGVLN